MKNERQRIPVPTRGRRLIIAAVTFGTMGVSTLAYGQAAASADSGPSRDALLQQVLQRMDAQDAEIKELKAELAAKNAPVVAPPATAAPATGATAAAPSPDAAPDVQAQIARQANEIAVLQRSVKGITADQNAGPTYPSLQFHGFGDVDYHVQSQKAEKNTFLLGEFDVFLGSQLSPDLDVLSETVISADNTNTDSIELERLLLQWDPSDYFNVDIGRFHTNIGYYNTAYHHGTWFQTATNRPFIDQFEDSGGIIPAHSVGISVHGNIPGALAQKLGLGYFAELGNGHQYENPNSGNNSVVNVVDENDFKAFNLAMIARPEAIPGLEVGAGVFHDLITPNAIDEAGGLDDAAPGSVTPTPSDPNNIRRTDEWFLHSHVVYKSADWEFMAEAYQINHEEHDGPNVWSPAYYVQLGRKYGDFTPYARFTYFNGDKSDPIYQLTQQTGQHYGPSIGVRYDWSTFVALKLQYDYFVNSQEGTALTLPFQQIPSGSYSEVEAQAAFTF
jgi:hypothetical protein